MSSITTALVSIAMRYGVIVLGMAVAGAVLPAPGSIRQADAQAASSAPPASPQLSAAALEGLVAPIALYPDDLVSVVLAASTLPLQIVEAERFLGQHNANPSLKPPTSWDPSVVALLNYPDVLAMMSKDLDWTQQLGNAVASQQADVLNAVQAYRKRVYDAGNLKSNPQQAVQVEGQTIVVQSADPQTIYVPQYNPQVVVVPVAAGAPLPYSYSPPYPYYASPAATFATGAIFGAAIGFTIGWSTHGIYTGNWGWGGYYRGGNNVTINRNNAVAINNTHITNSQRTQFHNQVTQNRENAWHPDRNARTSQTASLGATRQNTRVSSSEIRSALAHPGTPVSSNRTPQIARDAPRSGPSRSVAPTQRPGPGSGGERTAYRPSEGAFSGVQSGAAAGRFSNRGTASLRSSNSFRSGGARFQSGGGGRGFRR